MIGFRRWLVVTMGLGVLAAGCGSGGPGKDGSDDADSTAATRVPVEIAALDRGAMEAVVRASATLEAEGQVRVVAEAARRVIAIDVEEGDVVTAGDRLARLQDAEQRSSLRQAEIELTAAENELRRQEGLHARDLGSEQALDDARLDHERRRLAVDDARRELGYTQVRAPISGTVTQRLIKVGDQVQIGTELFEIIDFSSLVAPLYIPERHLPSLVSGLEARLTARALGGDPLPGRVERVSPIVDAGTGTVKVTVGVSAASGLRPGMFVDVGIVTRIEPDAVRVPKRALVHDDDRLFAFRLRDDDTVERVEVIPGLESAVHVEPRTGFAPGDAVVVAGQAGLKEGMAVEVVESRLP